MIGWVQAKKNNNDNNNKKKKNGLLEVKIQVPKVMEESEHFNYSFLPEQVLLNVALFLNIDSIGQFTQVNTDFHIVASSEAIWKKLYLLKFGATSLHIKTQSLKREYPTVPESEYNWSAIMRETFQSKITYYINFSRNETSHHLVTFFPSQLTCYQFYVKLKQMLNLKDLGMSYVFVLSGEGIKVCRMMLNGIGAYIDLCNDTDLFSTLVPNYHHFDTIDIF